MNTKVKILQHNRLDANSFVSVKLRKQRKNFTSFFWQSNKNFRGGWEREGQDVFTPECVSEWEAVIVALSYRMHCS